MAEFQVPSPGLCVITTFGTITSETAQCWMNLRSFTEKAGVGGVEWRMVSGLLVDKARNEAVRQMRAMNAQWLLMLDGDMVVPPDGLMRLLQVAYHTHTWADVVGGYCNLRGEPAIPTLDTGTGTWESWFPGSGVVEVMRTGAAFLLVKRHVVERLTDPWFKMRVPYGRWIELLADFDNLTRIKFDGRNPVRDTMPEFWEKLERSVVEDPSTRPDTFVPVEVGEDSGFADRVKLAGMRIVVDTDTILGHIDKKVIDWRDHKKALDQAARERRMMVGVL